jgi:hypothetical protein
MGLFFVEAVCLFFLWYFFGMLRSQQATVRDWIKTNALIVEAGVKEEERRPRGETGLITMWHPTVKYRYRAGDKTLVGETLRLYDDDALWYSSIKLAMAAGKKWSKGKTVAVHYNPANPGESCLEPVTITPYLFLGFTLLWMVLFPFMVSIMG